MSRRTPGIALLRLLVILAVFAAGSAAAHAQHETAPASADAVHGGDAHGAINFDEPPIQPDRSMLQLFVFSLALFLVFLFVARQLIWKPLIHALDEREERVNRAYAEAEAAKAEAAKLLQLHDQKMNEVQEQVKGIVAEARQQAEAEKARIIASADAEARELRDRALDEIRRAREEAMAGLLATVDRQVELATEHILGHRLN